METAQMHSVPVGSRPKAQRLKVLVVDDDPVITQLLRIKLEDAGHEVLIAADGRQGLEAVLQAAPQLVITDWQMPVMDGVELCQALRRLNSNQLLYIIMLTLRAEEDDLVQAFEAGADDYITKPFNPRVLEARIQAAERLIRLQKAVVEESEQNRRHLTELELLNQEVQAQRDRAQLYLDASEVMLLALDTEGGIELVNRKGCEILGYREDQLLHRNWFELCVHPEEQTPRRQWFNALVSGDHAANHYHESSVVTSRGERRIVAWHNNPIRDARGRIIGYLGSGHDITVQKQEQEERERLQRQLHQAQKMESIGHLTGGIAHDFNNILASMLGYCSLASERSEVLDDSLTQRYLREIHTSGTRAKELVAKMLAYSRGTGGAPKPLDVVAALQDTVTMLRGMLPPSVELDIHVDDGLPSLRFDLINFQQVLINLCVNARDALEGKGKIQISVQHVQVDHQECASCHQSIRGSFVQLCVADNGPGIERSMVSRIFEPFFTTKDVGKGSGLGLSVVHGIVHEQMGHIAIDSSPKAGTRFRLMFPAA